MSQRTKKTETTKPAADRIRFHPVTPRRWPDLEKLFGERGACGGCWCMVWRLGRKDWEAGKGEGNRRALKSLVDRRRPVGILAYAGREPVGWCAVAPRDHYSYFQRSRIFKPVDDHPVWSITCLFVARPWRRRGLSVRLIEEAAAHVASRGATMVEGYPVDVDPGAQPDAFVWTGLASAFRAAGFREVVRRSETRPLMRKQVGGKKRS